MRKIITFCFIAFFFISIRIHALPCLTAYQYRVPVSVNNTNGTQLNNFQVQLTLNTQALVSAGKMRIDGGDIRFTNAQGTNLSYWFDPNSFNTSTTEFWVKIDLVPIAGTTIYLFYGNPSATFVSSGDATFELFDDFQGAAIDPLKWTRCGLISNVSVIGGNVNFTSSPAAPDGMIYSNQLFSSTVLLEADIIAASFGTSLLGMTDATENGYATSMENTSGVDVMKLSRVDNSALSCQDLVLVGSANTAVNKVGIWSFQWPSALSQTISWGSGAFSATYTDGVHAGIFGTNKQVILGSHLNTNSAIGSLSVNWLRVRKLAAVADPIAVLGSEQEYPVNPNAQNTGPYCGGEIIQFSSSIYSGAVYAWKDPNNLIFSSSSNPTINPGAPANSGIYTLEVSVPGCPPVTSSTTVLVSPTSDAGSTSGNATICAGSNSGLVTVAGITGNVIRWEMANASGGPWFTSTNTSTSLAYSNLIQTTYFRPVVKTASCPEAIGSAAIITVDNATVAGFVIGGNSVCFGNNSGTLNLVYQNGNVNKWQQSIDNGANWTDIISNSTSYSFSNLTSTTLFRAEVQNGTCTALFSAPATINVNPLPVPSFTAAEVCEGFSSNFINTSTIPSGSIAGYQWDFGNSSSSISASPVYTYPSSGTFFVGLTAVSDAGCASSTNALVTVNPSPIVSFTAAEVCQGNATNFLANVTVSNGGNIASYFWDHANGSTSNLANHAYTYSLAGLYNVLLLATTNKGCVDSVRNYVTVASPVNVNFVSDSVCLGQSITFLNTSSTTSSSVAYTWDFGNGITSSLNNPVYTYPAAGQYTVSLQAQLLGSSSACISTVQKSALVYSVASPSFSFADVCASDSASYINSTSYSGNLATLSYAWSFGDASTSSQANPKHRYASPGNYSVQLTSTTQEGCNSSASQLISIYSMPASNYTFADVCLLSPMNFTSTSTVSNGTLSYQWDFDDGSNSVLQNPLHLYAADGVYNVVLIASTNFNCKDTIAKSVTVHPLPFVDFSNSPVCDGQPSSFAQQASVSVGSLVSFEWDFGDGSSSTSPIATHQYLNAGTYTVILTTTSSDGCGNDTSKTVVVNALPVSNFTIQDACLGSGNQFTNSSLLLGGGPLSYIWKFGDGDSSSLTSPNHTYGSAGLYPVTLVASSGSACADTLVKYAEVFQLPEVNAGADSAISKGEEIQLSGYSPLGVFYSWSPFTSLSNSSLPNTIARPFETTSYVLTMTDVNGCKNTDDVTVTVKDDFKLLIYNVLTPDGNGKNDFWKIGNIDFYPEAEVQIFNRWGEKIYSKKNYQNDWQGTYNKDELPDGSYYYIVSLPGFDSTYKGTITLLRNK